MDNSIAGLEGSKHEKESIGFRHAGKPKDQIWSFFEECEGKNLDGTFVKQQRCCYCGTKVSAKVERLKNHFAKCRKSSGKGSGLTTPEPIEKQSNKDVKRGFAIESELWNDEVHSEAVSRSGSTGNNDYILKDKVTQLEETFKKFRAEMDMKMSIMEQVLSTRNEIFSVQKQLVEREQALHATVLSHWKNIPELAATGLTLKFADIGGDEGGGDGRRNAEALKNISSSSSGKRAGSGAASARRGRRKRLKRKRMAADSDSESGVDYDGTGDNSGGDDEVAVADDDDNDASEDPNVERKVFVNYYSQEPAKSGQIFTRAPIWKYYLREESGNSALCKLCDEEGVQTILEMKRNSGTEPLHKHLKIKHTNVVLDVPPANETQIPESSRANKRLTNPIWNFFTKFNESGSPKASCNLCDRYGTGTVYRMCDGSTSILHNHLKKCHDLTTSDPFPLTSDDGVETAAPQQPSTEKQSTSLSENLTMAELE